MKNSIPKALSAIALAAVATLAMVAPANAATHPDPAFQLGDQVSVTNINIVPSGNDIAISYDVDLVPGAPGGQTDAVIGGGYSVSGVGLVDVLGPGTFSYTVSGFPDGVASIEILITTDTGVRSIPITNVTLPFTPPTPPTPPTDPGTPISNPPANVQTELGSSIQGDNSALAFGIGGGIVVLAAVAFVIVRRSGRASRA